jgi:aspartyl-tRNA(Asn)/glutamyl-tRNA(Gln) amidotransferase subunit B
VKIGGKQNNFMAYKTTIGLEIHIELNTKSKMFCGCANNPENYQPNTSVCPVCMGHPGTLPVINEEAVEKTIKTGLALNCRIPENSKFDRKNYFYPDLPKGYQISQYDMPLCQDGYLQIGDRKIKIKRVHLEEDTGRLVHPEGADYNKDGSISDKEKYSLVDFNRAGVPLMELVTEPDITSGLEAKAFAEELQQILHYLNVSYADMEKGQMRVEVNISLSDKEGVLGTKVEIKNLNSFRAVERGVDFEIQRQTELLGSGGKIIQETRGWDDVKGKTVSQREKEEAHDYRYFPEPDLPPLHFFQENIQKIKSEIPELPKQRLARFIREYELDENVAGFFVKNKEFGEYFEKVISEFEPNLPHEKIMALIKLSSNYLTSDLQGLLKGGSVKNEKFLITAENFSEFISLVESGKISSKIAKQVLLEMFSTGADPSNIIEEKGLSQISDEGEIKKVISEIISANPKVVADYKSGRQNALQFLVGQVMQKTKGKVNPQAARDILSKELTNLK